MDNINLEHEIALELLKIDTTVNILKEQVNDEEKITLLQIDDSVIELTKRHLIELGYTPIIIKDHKNNNRIAAIFAEGTNCNIAFQGHLDTVPTNEWDKECEYNWLGEITEKNEEKVLFGRGAIDMKAQIGALFASLYETNKRPHIILTTDEEMGHYSGFAGIHNTLDYMKRNNISPEFFVNMEASSFNVTYSRKGAMTVNIYVKGKSAHGSRPEEGINSIYRARRIIEAIENHIEEIKQIKDPVLGYRTINIGKISGGSRVNTVPDETIINLESRLIPGETGEQATEKLIAAISKQTGFTQGNEFEAILGMNYPPYQMPVEFAKSIAEKIPLAKGIGGEFGFAEDNFICNKGFNVIGFGPTNQHAHEPGEYVTLNDLTKCKDCYISLIENK